MEKNTEASLLKLARETARVIRKRTHIPGWHEDESRFPESDYKDILAMLEEAYRLGRTESEQAATRKHKALIDGLTDQAEWSGGSERGTMESLLDIFEPEELVQLGCGERVKAYVEEYGGDGDWEDINRKAAEHEAVWALHPRHSEPGAAVRGTDGSQRGGVGGRKHSLRMVRGI